MGEHRYTVQTFVRGRRRGRPQIVAVSCGGCGWADVRDPIPNTATIRALARNVGIEHLRMRPCHTIRRRRRRSVARDAHTWSEWTDIPGSRDDVTGWPVRIRYCHHCRAFETTPPQAMRGRPWTI